MAHIKVTERNLTCRHMDLRLLLHMLSVDFVQLDRSVPSLYIPSLFETQKQKGVIQRMVPARRCSSASGLHLWLLSCVRICWRLLCSRRWRMWKVWGGFLVQEGVTDVTDGHLSSAATALHRLGQAFSTMDFPTVTAVDLCQVVKMVTVNIIRCAYSTESGRRQVRNENS